MSGIVGHRGLLMSDVGAASADPHFESVAALLHFDGADGSTVMPDSSTFARTFSRTGAVISTAQSRFGGASLRVNGGIVSAPHAASIDLTVGDFTIECWVRLNVAKAGGQVIVVKNANQGISPYWVTVESSKLHVLCWNTSGTKVVDFVGTKALAINTWYHIAFCRSGSLFTSWVDGAADGSATSGAALRTAASESLMIGGLSGGVQNVDGFIDEFRLTKGVARYSASFTPPTVAFPDA